MSIDPVSIKPMSQPAFRSNPLLRALLRLVLPAAAITVALAIELSVAPRLHLPDAGPDLLLLVVLGFAAAWGPAGGAVVGFAAGLALDLAPPSVDAIGRHALVLTCVGALAGRAGRGMRESALRTCLLAGLYAGGAVLADTLVGALIGEGAGLDRPHLTASIGAAALYTAVATPLVVPGIVALARRTETPGARVLAPVGDALGPGSGFRSGPGSDGAYGGPAYDGITFRGAVTISGPEPRGASSLARTDSAPQPDLVAAPDPAAPDPATPASSPRGTRRAFQNPEAG